MNIENKIARIILIGCGPHAKRVYLPAINKINHIKLELIVDLESQESFVRSSLTNFQETELHIIRPFENDVPFKICSRERNFWSYYCH